MADTVYYKYGNFTHLPGEVVDCHYQIKPNLTKRGQIDFSSVRTELKIRALGCSAYEIQTREAQIYDAYNGSYQFAMYLPNGTLSKVLHEATGPNVIMPPRTHIVFPTGEDEEYATKRDITVVIESMINSCTDQIIHFEETIKDVGYVGPRYEWQNTVRGPRMYELWPSATKTIIQEGYSIGFQGYVIANVVPILPAWWPSGKQNLEDVVEEPGTPIKMPKGYFYYPFRWHYSWETIDSTSYFPIGPFPTYPP